MKNMIDRAVQIAFKAHEIEKRRDGKGYITHVKAVVEYLIDEWLSLLPYPAQCASWSKTEVKDCVIAAAWLHDVIENSCLTIEDLKKEGFPPMVYEIVAILTRRDNESYFDYIMRIHDSGAFRVGAAAIKLADLHHNINDNLPEGSQKDKYRFAEYILSSPIRNS